MKLIRSEDQRPVDEQVVLYYFAPFNKWYEGQYLAFEDSVYDKGGFTTILPECPFWMPKPILPADYVNEFEDLLK